MDEHQRRVWAQIPVEIDRYRHNEVSLGRLVANLGGLLGATDLHDQTLVGDFWNHLAPIDAEHELRTQPWAPVGSASDDNLDAVLTAMSEWALQTIEHTRPDRS
jgi:hypothetical protein